MRETGVPVIGHLGLTPQSLGTVQAYKVAGKQKGEIRELKKNVSISSIQAYSAYC